MQRILGAKLISNRIAGVPAAAAGAAAQDAAAGGVARHPRPQEVLLARHHRPQHGRRARRRRHKGRPPLQQGLQGGPQGHVSRRPNAQSASSSPSYGPYSDANCSVFRACQDESVASVLIKTVF